MQHGLLLLIYRNSVPLPVENILGRSPLRCALHLFPVGAIHGGQGDRCPPTENLAPGGPPAHVTLCLNNANNVINFNYQPDILLKIHN